jgi:hypothetical protein
MKIRESPDSAEFSGSTVDYTSNSAITFGVVDGYASRNLNPGELLIATRESLTRDSEFAAPSNPGYVTHAKLPYLTNAKLRNHLRGVVSEVEEAYDNLPKGRKRLRVNLIRLSNSIRSFLSAAEDGTDDTTTYFLTYLRNSGLDLPINIEDVISSLSRPEFDAFIHATDKLDNLPDFDRDEIFSICGRAWILGDTFLVSFWGDPSTDAMKGVSQELARKMGWHGNIMVQNDSYEYDEWVPIGVSVKILGDDIMREIKKLSSGLHTATPEEKLKIRNKIKSLRVKAGIEDTPIEFGSAKKAKIAAKAGYNSTAEYNAAVMQESLERSLNFIVGSLVM